MNVSSNREQIDCRRSFESSADSIYELVDSQTLSTVDSVDNIISINSSTVNVNDIDGVHIIIEDNDRLMNCNDDSRPSSTDEDNRYCTAAASQRSSVTRRRQENEPRRGTSRRRRRNARFTRNSRNAVHEQVGRNSRRYESRSARRRRRRRSLQEMRNRTSTRSEELLASVENSLQTSANVLAEFDAAVRRVFTGLEVVTTEVDERVETSSLGATDAESAIDHPFPDMITIEVETDPMEADDEEVEEDIISGRSGDVTVQVPDALPEEVVPSGFVILEEPAEDYNTEEEDVESQGFSAEMDNLQRRGRSHSWRSMPKYELTPLEAEKQEADLYYTFFNETNHEAIQLAKQGDRQCCVCYDNKATRIVIPCGHQCLCFSCAQSVALNRTKLPNGDIIIKKCPMCRAAISQMIRPI